MRKTLLAACAVLFAGALFADEITKRSILTVNEPVIVSGVPVVTLEPGTYSIRVLTHEHSRNIVQIFNERGDKLYTTVLAIPNYRLNTKNEPELRFWETPSGNPIALRAWFPSGENWGQEFVYPKGLAAKIARETGEPVKVATAETAKELETAPITEVNKEGVEKPVEEAFVPEPAPAPVEAAPAIAEAAPAPAPAPEPEPLPATGSPFFMIGLAGAAAAIAGAGLRRAVRRP
jgi:hypothetical protein